MNNSLLKFGLCVLILSCTYVIASAEDYDDRMGRRPLPAENSSRHRGIGRTPAYAPEYEVERGRNEVDPIFTQAANLAAERAKSLRPNALALIKNVSRNYPPLQQMYRKFVQTKILPSQEKAKCKEGMFAKTYFREGRSFMEFCPKFGTIDPRLATHILLHEAGHIVIDFYAPHCAVDNLAHFIAMEGGFGWVNTKADRLCQITKEAYVPPQDSWAGRFLFKGISGGLPRN